MLENIIYLFVGAGLAILPNYIMETIKRNQQKKDQTKYEKNLLIAFCNEIGVAISDFYRVKKDSIEIPTPHLYGLHFGLWELTKSKIFEKIEDAEILWLLIRIYDNFNNINSALAEIVKEGNFSSITKISLSVAEKDYKSLKEKIESKYKIKFNTHK